MSPPTALSPDAAAARANDPSLASEAARSALAAGDTPRAIAWFERAATLAPDRADVRAGLANAYAAAGLAMRARAEHEHAVRLAPADPPASTAIVHRRPATTAEGPSLVAQALAALERRAHDDAERMALAALVDAPEDPAALEILGLVDGRRGEHAAAIAIFERVLRLRPSVAQYHYNLAVALQKAGCDRFAMIEYAATLRLDPAHANALYNYAGLLRTEERFDAALDCYHRLGAINGGFPGLLLGVAVCLYGLRRMDDAAAAFRKAQSAAAWGGEGYDPLLLWEMAHCLLSHGDWQEGWDLYERRFELGNRIDVHAHPFPFARWSGEPLAGRTLLVHGEQRLGDEIMFASVLPEIVAEARHVVIATSPALVRLFQESFPKAVVVPQARTPDGAWLARSPDWLRCVGPIDFQVPIASLGALRRRTPHAFTAHHGYLVAARSLREHWRAYLDAMAPASRGERRIGLMWSANPARRRAHGSRRSQRTGIPARELEQLAGRGLGLFVSLQNAEGALEGGLAPRLDIVDCHREIRDMADTAALIASLDAVVAFDTSVLHLAGALGKPTFALLPWDCDYRWGHAGARTPWYPSMRLVRQPAPDAWAPAIHEVAGLLQTLER